MATLPILSVNPSGQAAVDSLLLGRKWSSNALTYSFRTSVSSDSDFATGFAPLNAAQQAAARQALARWAAVCNLTFTEVPDTDNGGIIRLGTCSSTIISTSAAYYPNADESGGDVWFGNSSSSSPTNPVPGGYAFDTFVHELGHSIGLKHPHTAFGVFPAASVTQDAMQNTVMSYRSYLGDSASGGYGNASDSYAYAPMAYDIAAAQYLYWANFDFNSGNTTYVFNPNRPVIFAAIWDGGGVDTYDLSSYFTSVSVDLQPGAWTTSSVSQLAQLNYYEVAYGYSSTEQLAPGNVCNALLYNDDTRSLIENAVGGAGNDTLTGNQCGNLLCGGAGNDQLWGGAGNDTLTGGSGSNAFLWGSSEGNDIVTGTTGKDAMVFYNFAAGQRAGSFNSAGDMMFGFRTGTEDKVTVAGWRNHVSTDRVQSLVFCEGGTLKAYAWNDHAPVEVNLFDGAYASLSVSYLECIDYSDAKLRGASGNDVIKGGAGNDILWGGAGADTMIGGNGTDTFYWGRGDGDDRIEDGKAGEQVMLYTAGLTISDVSISVSGATLTLNVGGSTLSVSNWSSEELNKFVFGYSSTAGNTYKVAATSGGFGWQQF